MIVTEELQSKWNAILLDILKTFIGICKENNLTYYCCGGTAIGAVRHKGFIPWDDDIDVLMPRPDYDRFIEITQATGLGNYEVVTQHNKKDYPLSFAKLCNSNTTLIEEADTPCVYGLYIDIFPIDGAPDNYDDFVKIEKRFVKTRNKLEAISTHNTFAEYISLLGDKKEWGRFVRKTFGFFFRKAYRTSLIKQLDDICYKYAYDKCNMVAVYSGAYELKETYPKEWLDGTSQFTFEGLDVALPKNYDAYLRHYFGDYTQLPPIEKRVSHHQKAYFNMDMRVDDATAKKKARE